MSNEHHHISSLVTDLVEMAQATKRLPELERELREAYQRIDQLVSRSQELESKIMSEVAINTDLASKLHAAEVARDDAGFRQLEAEDKAGTLLQVFENMLSSMGETIAAVKGDGKDRLFRMASSEMQEYWEYQRAKEAAAAKQAEEAAKPMDPIPASGVSEQPPYAQSASVDLPTTVASTEGQSATDPTGANLEAGPSPSAEPSPWSPIGYYSGADQAKGVSVLSDPTVSPQTSPSETAPGSTAPEQAGAPIGKYANRRYADWPYFVSEAGWIEGGGTHESYWVGREAWANVQKGL